MKFYDIPAEIITVRVKRTDRAEPLTEQPVASVSVSLTRPDEFEIRIKDTTIIVKLVEKTDVRRLNNELVTGKAMLAQLANTAADGSIDLQIAFFTDEREMGDIEIGVDEYVEDGIEKINRRKLTGMTLYNYLKDRCCFFCGDDVFFFISTGHAIDDVLKQEEMENIKAGSAPRPDSIRQNSFCVTGNGIRFIASEMTQDGKSIYIPSKLHKIKNRADKALRLARGKLKFIDWTKAGQIQALTKAQLSFLIKDQSSYLKKWDEFGDTEGALLLERARKVDVLHYCDSQQTREGYVSVRICQAPNSAFELLEKGTIEEVENVDEIPDYLENKKMTFAEFSGGIERSAEKDKILGEKSKEKKKKKKHIYFNIKGYDKTTKTLTIYDKESKSLGLETKNLPSSGKLILSLAGEIAIIKRRMSSRKAILEGRSANPQLGLLIEEKGEIRQIRTLPKIKPLTAFVKNNIFEENQPTLNQEKAIETALMTPDIALIQGPPGTGKTTVIAAILERLNEMADKRGINIKGQVLLTGFQHDAVENIITRYYLNGLPIPKIGKRSESSENDFNAFEIKLNNWCAEVAANIKEKNKDIITNVKKENEIVDAYLQYLNAPTRALSANLAKKIDLLGPAILGPDTSVRAANIAKKLSVQETLNNESNPKLDAVRRLRTRPESFADDGPDRAADALEDLEDSIKADERKLLNNASLWYDQDKSPPFLKELAELKKKLLVRFTFPPVFRAEKQNDEIISLAQEAIKKIRDTGFSSTDKKASALAEFTAELESNPYGMIDAVSDYSFAFAATCQQSVNELMQELKDITPYSENNRMEYEYVIVDEAARVSPRDLMIPMALGKRIILVGDHRQLPHIIDDEVARQMEEGETGKEESVWLEKSMFEYLFSERLDALKQKDGITRRVTLNTQYRMHPVLGDFISRNFYQRFAQEEKFESVRPESDFEHNLTDTDKKPAVWLDVPVSKGKSSYEGFSMIREVESTVIAQKLKIWINSEEGKDLSYGVISFYKAQAELIKNKLGKITDDKNKLRIGTVDSFQGMEFDVVFLSMVRTFRQDWKPKDENSKKQAYNLFGHLCLYNRLNVSMSRQKKLLVVVGDSGLLKNDLAKDFIPGLVDFYDLCQKKGKVLYA